MTIAGVIGMRLENDVDVGNGPVDISAARSYSISWDECDVEWHQTKAPNHLGPFLRRLLLTAHATIH